MQEATTKLIYDFHAAFYDITFGRLVRKRIEKAIAHMPIGEHDMVLDLGIGTGCSLGFYPRRGRVVGIDLSNGMLEKAQRKIEQQAMAHTSLVQADAMRLPFADNSFDHIFISHVISVVSDPCRLVREAQRVAKPGARIVILNHFQSANRMVALFEKWLCPLCTRLGWRSDLPLQDLIRKTGLQVEYRYQLTTPDLWETVVTINDKSALKAAEAA